MSKLITDEKPSSCQVGALICEANNLTSVPFRRQLETAAALDANTGCNIYTHTHTAELFQKHFFKHFFWKPFSKIIIYKPYRTSLTDIGKMLILSLQGVRRTEKCGNNMMGHRECCIKMFQGS